MSPARKIGLLITAVALSIGAYNAIADGSLLPLVLAGLISIPFATQGA